MTKSEQAISRMHKKDREEFKAYFGTKSGLMDRVIKMRGMAWKETDQELQDAYFKRAAFWLGKYIERLNNGC